MRHAYILALLCISFLHEVEGQNYPYALSSLANDADSIVDHVFSIAVDTAGAPIDSLLGVLEAYHDNTGLTDRQMAAAKTTIGYFQVAKGERDEAFVYYREALPLVEGLSEEDIVYSVAHGSYGMYMAHYQVYDLAIPHLKKALPGLSKLNENGSFKEDGLYMGIIQGYYAIGQKDSAMLYQHKMVQAARRVGSPTAISEAYNSAGFYFTRAQMYDSAFQYFNNAISVLDTNNADELRAYVNALESRVHPNILLGHFNEGIADLKYVYDVRKRLDLHNLALQTLAYLINYSLENARTDDVWKFVRNELDYVHSREELTLRSANAYLALANLYTKRGMPVEAEPYINSYNTFLVSHLRKKGSLDGDARNNLNTFMTYRNQAYEQGLELARRDQEKMQQNLRQSRLLVLFMSIVLLLLIGLVYAIGKWRSIRREKILALEKKNNEALQLKNQNLHYELLLKEKDIRRIAADNKIRTTLKQRFLRQLKGLEKYRGNDLQKELVLLIHSLEHTIDNQEQLSLMQENIEHINASFEHRLSEKISGISASEMKLCSLIKLGMSNQDIARILHKEDSTIRSYKYRLKKKAGLNSVRELEETIKDL